MKKFSSKLSFIIQYIFIQKRYINRQCKVLKCIVLTFTYCFDFGGITEYIFFSIRKKSCGSKIAMV